MNHLLFIYLYHSISLYCNCPSPSFCHLNSTIFRHIWNLFITQRSPSCSSYWECSFSGAEIAHFRPLTFPWVSSLSQNYSIFSRCDYQPPSSCTHFVYMMESFLRWALKFSLKSFTIMPVSYCLFLSFTILLFFIYFHWYVQTMYFHFLFSPLKETKRFLDQLCFVIYLSWTYILNTSKIQLSRKKYMSY